MLFAKLVGELSDFLDARRPARNPNRYLLEPRCLFSLSDFSGCLAIAFLVGEGLFGQGLQFRSPELLQAGLLVHCRLFLLSGYALILVVWHVMFQVLLYTVKSKPCCCQDGNSDLTTTLAKGYPWTPSVSHPPSASLGWLKYCALRSITALLPAVSAAVLLSPLAWRTANRGLPWGVIHYSPGSPGTSYGWVVLALPQAPYPARSGFPVPAGERKSLMPRPAVDALDRRQPFSGLRLSQRELNSIRERAEEAGLSVSEFIRQSALSSTVRAAPAVSIRQWSDLAPLASNLNQIAYRLNAGQQDRLSSTDRQTLAELDDLLREIRLRLLDVEPDAL